MIDINNFNMNNAQNRMDEFKKLPIITVTGALFISLPDCESWTEYVDSKNCFIYTRITYINKSILKIHKSGKILHISKGKIIESLNIYTHINKNAPN